MINKRLIPILAALLTVVLFYSACSKSGGGQDPSQQGYRTISGILKGSDGLPIANLNVAPKDQGPVWYTGVKTDANGRFSLKFPVNTFIELNVMNDCGVILKILNVGALKEDKDLGVIILTSNSLLLSATVVTCNNEPVENGYAIIKLGDETHKVPFTNGQLNSSIRFCNSTSNMAAIKLVDLIHNDSTFFIDWDTRTTGARTFKVCGLDATNQTFKIIYDNGSGFHQLKPDNDIFSCFREGSNSTVELRNKDNSVRFRITFTGATGDQSQAVTDFQFQANGKTFVPVTMNPVKILSYGDAGKIVYGEFSGTMKNVVTNEQTTLTGDFSARRLK